MRLVENYVARAEQLINPIDWVPFVASFSGMIRILAGAVQVAVGMVFAIIKIIHIMLTNRGTYCSALEQGFIYSMHGVGNIIRGSIAMIPYLNVILYIHDMYLGRMNYPQEKMQPGVYPLMTAYRLVQY